MILSETIFVAGKPVGVVRQNSHTREIAFSPVKPPSKVRPHNWHSIDQLKNAVIAAYEGKGQLSPRTST